MPVRFIVLFNEKLIYKRLFFYFFDVRKLSDAFSRIKHKRMSKNKHLSGLIEINKRKFYPLTGQILCCREQKIFMNNPIIFANY